MSQPVPHLDLSVLTTGLPCIEASYCASLGSAAAVALEGQGHVSGVKLAVGGDYTTECTLGWPPVLQQARNTYADPDEATELGACGLAFVLCQHLMGYTVIQRSKRGTGFDYWIGPDGDIPFQNQARMEVSGLGRATDPQVQRRVREKVKQTAQSAGTFPAVVIVVEFSQPRSQVVAA